MLEALDAVDRIEDPEARSRAQVQVTAEVRERSAQWVQERSALAQQIRDQEEKETIRGIAKRLGVSPGTVQDLLNNYRGSGQRRPRKEPSTENE